LLWYDVFRNMFDTLPEPGQTPQQYIQNLAISYNFLVEQHPDIVKVVLNWSASFGGTVRPQYLEFQDWVLSGIQDRLHRANSDKGIGRG